VCPVVTYLVLVPGNGFCLVAVHCFHWGHCEMQTHESTEDRVACICISFAAQLDVAL